MPKWKDKLKHGKNIFAREVNNFITDAETKIKAEAVRQFAAPESKERELWRAKGLPVRVERERALEAIRDTQNAFFGTSWTLKDNRESLEEILSLLKQQSKGFTETEEGFRAIQTQQKQLASNQGTVILALKTIFANIQYERELQNEPPLKSFEESWRVILIEIGRLELDLLDPQVLERLKVSNRQADQNRADLLKAIRKKLEAENKRRTIGIPELSSPEVVSEASVLRAFQASKYDGILYEDILYDNSAVREAIAKEQAAESIHNSEIQKLQKPQQSCGQEGEGGACPSTTSGVSSGPGQKSRAGKATTNGI